MRSGGENQAEVKWSLMSFSEKCCRLRDFNATCLMSGDQGEVEMSLSAVRKGLYSALEEKFH